jgi:hypothetical protein
MPGWLKPLDVERETKSGKYADGDGLYLVITGPAAKSWSYRWWGTTSASEGLSHYGMPSTRFSAAFIRG